MSTTDAAGGVTGGGDDGAIARTPTFQANRCSRGACAESILRPSLLTKAAPEFASSELRCRVWSDPTGLPFRSSVLAMDRSPGFVVVV